MRKIAFFNLVAVACLLAATACDSSRKQIVGKWKSVGSANESVWEFFDNGTLSAGGAPGRYTFGDNNRIKIQTQSATFVHRLELKEDRMIWIDPTGSKLEFTRAK